MGIHDQGADAAETLAFQIHFIGVDVGCAGQGGGQQGAEPGSVPLAVAEAEEGLAQSTRRIDPEGSEEGGARRNDLQVAVQQHEGRG